MRYQDAQITFPLVMVCHVSAQIGHSRDITEALCIRVVREKCAMGDYDKCSLPDMIKVLFMVTRTDIALYRNKRLTVEIVKLVFVLGD